MMFVGALATLAVACAPPYAELGQALHELDGARGEGVDRHFPAEVLRFEEMVGRARRELELQQERPAWRRAYREPRRRLVEARDGLRRLRNAAMPLQTEAALDARGALGAAKEALARAEASFASLPPGSDTTVDRRQARSDLEALRSTYSEAKRLEVSRRFQEAAALAVRLEDEAAAVRRDLLRAGARLPDAVEARRLGSGS